MDSESKNFSNAPEILEMDKNFSHGEISMSHDELAYLDEARHGEFENHPVLKGVFVRSLEAEMAPSEIKMLIKKLGAEISSFSAVRIENEVPVHQHTSDGEIYFGGINGVVSLFDASKNEIGKFNLSDGSYTVTRPDEYHGVSSNNPSGSTFFGVKFISKKQ